MEPKCDLCEYTGKRRLTVCCGCGKRHMLCPKCFEKFHGCDDECIEGSRGFMKQIMSRPLSPVKGKERWGQK